MKKILDISRWNGNIDCEKMKSQMIDGIIIKSTQGTSFVDPKFFINRDKAIAAELEWCAYHYYVANQDPVLQARHFCSTVNDKTRRLVADIEDPNSIPSDYVTRVLRFLTEIENITGFRPTIYTRESYWKLYLYNATNWADFYDVWVAHYKNSSGPLVPMPWTPEDWLLWQFTDRASGRKYGTESLQVDLNTAKDRFSFTYDPNYNPLHSKEELFLAASKPLPSRDKFPIKAYLQEKLYSWRFNLRKD